MSLLDYLRLENPLIDSTPCTRGSNTTSKKFKWHEPRIIREWDDFEYKALQSMYGGELRTVLERHFELRDFSGIPQFPFREMHDEDSLECLLVKWNHSIVSDALSTAQDHLDDHLSSTKIYMVKGGQADYPDSNSKLRPDWGAIRRPWSALSENKNILPGDTKLSTKWTSDDIERGYCEHRWTASCDWFSPLKQIYTYCIRANARYGYLITDKELVVLRITPTQEYDSQSGLDNLDSQESFRSLDPTPASRARDAGILEYKAIPWQTDDNITSNDSNSEAMTVNLALWWLHIMAADCSAIEDLYVPLRNAAWNAEADAGQSLTSSFALSEMSGMSEVRQELSDVTKCQSNNTGSRRNAKSRKRRRGEDEVNQGSKTFRVNKAGSRR